MKRKNKLLLSVLCLTGLSGILAVTGMSKLNSEILLFASNGTQQWNHYSAVAPTFDSNGSKEYWVSCSDPSHPIQFTAPTGDVKITNMGAPSAEFVNSLDSSDARYAAKLPKSVSFEDGQIPSVLSVVQGEARVTDSKATLGTKSLAVSTVGSGTFRIAFDRNWLNAIFNSNDAIYFDLVAEKQASNFYYNSASDQWGVKRYAGEGSIGAQTIWNTYTFSRAFFEDLKSDNVVIRVDDSPENTIYIDNIRFGGTTNIVSLENNYISGVYVKSAFDASTSLHVNTSGTFELSNTRASEGTTSLHLVSASDANIYVPTSFYQKAQGSGILYDLYVEPKDGAMHIYPTDSLKPAAYINSDNCGRWTTLYIPYEGVDVVNNTWARILGTRSNANGFDIYVDNIRIASEAWSFEQEHVLENNLLTSSFNGAGILHYKDNNLEVSDEKSYTGSYSLKFTANVANTRNIGISHAMYLAIPEGGSIVMRAYTDTAFNGSVCHIFADGLGKWVELTIPKTSINSSKNDHYLGTIYAPVTFYIDDIRIVGPAATAESANADILDLGADDVWYN